jgi:hypothetical protein
MPTIAVRSTMHNRLAVVPALIKPVLLASTRAFSAVPARLQPPPDDRPSLVKSFLYGSEKGQELQREMEQSYSKVLARGKYVHKINTHHVKPNKIHEYVALMYVAEYLDLVPMFFLKSPTTPRIKCI